MWYHRDPMSFPKPCLSGWCLYSLAQHTCLLDALDTKPYHLKDICNPSSVSKQKGTSFSVEGNCILSRQVTEWLHSCIWFIWLSLDSYVSVHCSIPFYSQRRYTGICWKSDQTSGVGSSIPDPYVNFALRIFNYIKNTCMSHSDQFKITSWRFV